MVIILNNKRNFKLTKKNFKKKKYFILDNALKFFRQGWVYAKKIINKIYFKISRNDGLESSTKVLTKLKLLFSTQLPNIPRLYIGKQILDKKHILITLIKFNRRGKTIIGSCCFRIFESNQFLELIFFAVSTKTQGFGYGAYLMSFLKDFAKSIKIRFVITCADNNAINFFLKQGFSRLLSNSISIWFRHIREYEEVELMECVISSKNSYFFSYLALILQKTLNLEKIKKLIKPRSKRHNQKEKTKKNFDFSSKISEKSKKKINFQSKLFFIIDEFRSDRFLLPFFEPVDLRKMGIDGYFEHLINSTDIRSIEEKIRTGNLIITKKKFLQLIKRMINNSILFNGELHSIEEICHRIKGLFYIFPSPSENRKF